MRYTDKEIVDGIRQGNSKIYNFLKSDFYPWCRNWVVLHGDTEEDAEELFNSTYMKVREKIISGEFQLDGRARFRTYFNGVFKKLWLNFMVKHTKEKALYIDIDPDDMPPFDVDIEKHERFSLVNAYVNRLHDICRHFMHLHYFLGMDYEIIGLRVERSMDAVKQEVYRNRIALKEALKNK